MNSEPSAVSWKQSNTTSSPALLVQSDAVFGSVQELLCRKWHLRIVYHLLQNGPMGFSGLKDAIEGISSKMLSESLTNLEDIEIVDREIVNDQPVRVEYSLTERGSSLDSVVSELVVWATEHGPEDET